MPIHAAGRSSQWSGPRQPLAVKARADAHFTPAIQAMWLWHTSLILSDPSQVLAFAQTHGINRIYVQVSRSVPSSAYASFIGNASSDGIAIEALDGDPSWAQDPNHAGLLSFVSWTAAYNAAAPQAARFAGLHLDMEPYTLPAWQTNRDAVIQDWQFAIQAFEVAAHQAHLPTCIDLPFWLDNFTVSGSQEPLGSWMLQHADSIAIMAYRTRADGPNGIAAISQPLLLDAASMNRPVVIGVDTTSASTTSGVSASFSNEQELTQQLTLLGQILGKDPSYAGYSVNEYETWSTMLPLQAHVSEGIMGHRHRTLNLPVGAVLLEHMRANRL